MLLAKGFLFGCGSTGSSSVVPFSGFLTFLFLKFLLNSLMSLISSKTEASVASSIGISLENLTS